MDKRLKVIIVDDHDMFREGVKVLLGKSQKVEFIGEAANGQEFLELIKTLTPDVVLMDISMPVVDGIEATRLAVQADPDIKILALSMFGEEEYYYKMIQSGVRGFVLKSAGINELEHAIEQVAKGSAYFSEDLLKYVKNHIRPSEATEKAPQFSDKETQILKLIGKNYSDEEIAHEINLSAENVKKMRLDLLKKCGSSNTPGLIMYAVKYGIIEL